MYKGGRPKDLAWEDFDECELKGKAKCKGCHKLVSGKADRLRAHKKKCPASAIEPSNMGGAFASLQESATTEPPAVHSAPPQRVQSSIKGHFVSTSPAEKAKLDQCVAEFIIAANLPFSVVEHPKFIAMVEEMHPGYKPPTRKAVGGTLLDKIHTDLQSNMKSKLQNKVVTMQQDGWSTPANEPVILTSVTCEGVGYFIDAQLTGSKSKTAEACQEMLTESKAFAEETFGCHVRSVVTDNAPAMTKMRDGLERDDQDLITYGCLAHYLNLIGKDITDKNVLVRVEDIQKHFRRKHIPGALLGKYEDSVRSQISAEY